MTALKPCKPLTIKQAKRTWRPATTKDKKGQPKIDPDTGLAKTSWVPMGYRITFSDDTWVSVTISKGEAKFSYNRPGPQIIETWNNKPTGERGKPQQTFPASTWKVFEEHFQKKANIPALVLLGMEMADEEMEQRRAA